MFNIYQRRYFGHYNLLNIKSMSSENDSSTSSQIMLTSIVSSEIKWKKVSSRITIFPLIPEGSNGAKHSHRAHM
jgi:hypothetical protein